MCISAMLMGAAIADLAAFASSADQCNWRATLSSAQIALQNHDPRKAMSLAQAALVEENRQLFPQHPAFLQTYSLLARSSLAAGEHQIAQRYLEKEFDLEYQLLGVGSNRQTPPTINSHRPLTQNSAVLRNTGRALANGYRAEIESLMNLLSANVAGGDQQKDRSDLLKRMTDCCGRFRRTRDIVGYDFSDCQLLGAGYFAAERWTDAKVFFEKALSEQEKHEQASETFKGYLRAKLAIVYAKLGDSSKLANASQSTFSGDISAVIATGGSLIAQQHYEDAVKLYEQQLALAQSEHRYKDSAELTFRIACALSNVADRKTDVENNYKESLALHRQLHMPADWETASCLEALAQAAFDRGDKKESIADWKLAADIRRNDYERFSKMGRGYAEAASSAQGTYLKNIQHLKEAGR
jgi:tetratricopeptide (TPR) repeat protein